MATVLHVAEAFSTGIVHSISKICWGLDRDVQFHVLHGNRVETPKDYRTYFPPSVQFTPWNVSRKLDLRADFAALRELQQAIHRIQPDLIHAHSSKAGGLARLLPPSNGTKIIYSPRGYSFLQKDVSVLKRLIYRTIERALGARSHITVACGIGEYRVALEVTKHAHMIPNMIDLHEYDVVKRDSVEPEIMVAMVGRICAQKNFPLFCRIAAAVQDLGMKFLWIGDGPVPPDVKIPDNVSITGWLSKQDVSKTLSRCKIFLQTSLWEGLPIAVLEGMAVGLAILAKPAVGNTELVIEGVNGHLCNAEEEFVDRLRELSSEPERLHQLGEASRQLVEDHYSKDKILARWRSLYLNYDRYLSSGFI